MSQRKYGFFAHPILMGDRFVGFLEAEVDRDHEALVVAAVHELLPFDAEEHEMVQAEMANLGQWLRVDVRAWVTIPAAAGMTSRRPRIIGARKRAPDHHSRCIAHPLAHSAPQGLGAGRFVDSGVLPCLPCE